MAREDRYVQGEGGHVTAGVEIGVRYLPAKECWGYKITEEIRKDRPLESLEGA